MTAILILFGGGLLAGAIAAGAAPQPVPVRVAENRPNSPRKGQ